MIDSIVGHPYEEADAVLIGVPFDNSPIPGESTQGGPEAVVSILDGYLEFFDKYSKSSPAYDHKFGYKILEECKNQTATEMVEHISTLLVNENRFALLIGGAHTVSIGAFKAIAEKYTPATVTIVQIDAHFDLRDDDSDYNDVNPSTYAHSTVMRRAHELGFNILPIGIRTMSEKEYTYATENNITYFEWGRHDEVIPKIETLIENIHTEHIYLTVDIDGFDPSVMPGTATPVSGGLSWQYGESLVRQLMQTGKVIGADIVEIAPISGNPLSEYNVAQLAYYILGLSSNLS